MIGDVLRFLSTFKTKKGSTIRETSDRKLVSFLRKYDRDFHLRQILLAERFISEIPKGPNKIKIVAPVDRLSAFVLFPGMLEFARGTLLEQDFALLLNLARAAYRADDSDFPDLVVGVLR
jgi:hypothetical protein